MNWLLIVTAVIIACCAFYGYKQGILRIVFSFGSLIVAIVLSSVLTPYVNGFLRNHTPVYEKVQEKCEVLLEQSDPERQEIVELSQEETDAISGEEQTDIESILKGQALPESLKRAVEQISSSMESQVLNAKAAVADGIADMILSALSFMITLVVIRVLIWIVFHMLDVISKLPVIHGVNQFTGLAFGLLEGLLAVWVFFVFLTCILQTSFGQSCMTMITESRILTFLYDYNILTIFFR